MDPTMTPCPQDACERCGGGSFRPEPDVMDTWMTSSLTPLLNANWTEWHAGANADAPIAAQARPAIYPMGVRVQAFEIIRTWLFYTVAKSHLHTGSVPWRDVMISGWGLDRQGKKMSKRAGNFVDPAEVIAKYSADSLRYWAAGATLGQDLRYLEDDVKGGKRLLTKIWNSTRFAMQQLGGYVRGAVAEQPTVADRWVRSELVGVVNTATSAFEQYEYSKALRAVETFFWGTWCDNYLEIVKERFRPGARFSAGEVAAAQRTIFEGTYALLRLFAPVLPFISEELYQLAVRPLLGATAPGSVHKAPWPESEMSGQVDVFDGRRDEAAEVQGALLAQLVGAVRGCKTAQKLGGGRPLEVIYVAAPDGHQADLAPLEADWLAASRAARCSFGIPAQGHEGGAPTYPAGTTGFLVGIIAAPADAPAA